MQANELLDKVVYYKGRVWTIYSTSRDGVLAYQGLKPFSSFDYYKDSQRYSSFKKNTTYINQDEIMFLNGDEIKSALKKEEREMKKPLSRKKAIDFYVYFTGHSKAFVSKNLEEKHHSFDFTPGAVWYQLWKMDGALYLSHNMDGSSHHVNYDFITFEPHDILNDKRWESIKNEIIDDFKAWKGIS